MTSTDHLEPERLDELLAGHALGDLSPAETAELQEKMQEAPETTKQLVELEATAAAADLAFGISAVDPLPADVHHRIRLNAARFLPPRVDPPSVSHDSPRPALRPAEPQSRRVHGRELLAWLALAASLLLAVGLWRTGIEPVAVGPDAETLSPAERRERLLDAGRDTIRVAWSPGATPFEDPVEGDVVWSNDRQTGFMRFEGMPVNDPQSEQYQLWIVDPQRDEQPIDGGVFDVTSDGEVIVPIDAKLRVVDPQLFAVTIEKPGGVVVSTQERLPLLAKLP